MLIFMASLLEKNYYNTRFLNSVSGIIPYSKNFPWIGNVVREIRRGGNHRTLELCNLERNFALDAFKMKFY